MGCRLLRPSYSRLFFAAPPSPITGDEIFGRQDGRIAAETFQPRSRNASRSDLEFLSLSLGALLPYVHSMWRTDGVLGALAVVEEVKRTADLEMTMARERFEVALRQKDMEVERYKVELDNILTTLLELKQQVGWKSCLSNPSSPAPTLPPPCPLPDSDIPFYVTGLFHPTSTGLVGEVA